jgi:hypothetical protein
VPKTYNHKEKGSDMRIVGVQDIDDMSVHVAFCRLQEIWIRKKKSVSETFEEPLVLATDVALLKQLLHLFL